MSVRTLSGKKVWATTKAVWAVDFTPRDQEQVIREKGNRLLLHEGILIGVIPEPWNQAEAEQRTWEGLRNEEYGLDYQRDPRQAIQDFKRNHTSPLSIDPEQPGGDLAALGGN